MVVPSVRRDEKLMMDTEPDTLAVDATLPLM